MAAHQARLDVLAFCCIVLRMEFIMLYLAGLSTARFIVWTLALAVNIGILSVGWRQPAYS